MGECALGLTQTGENSLLRVVVEERRCFAKAFANGLGMGQELRLLLKVLLLAGLQAGFSKFVVLELEKILFFPVLGLGGGEGFEVAF